MIMTASQTIRLETELLILGTGAAGCGAALAARQAGIRTLMVDKGKLESSGCLGGGNDHFIAVLNTDEPQDTIDDLVKAYLKPSSGYSEKQIRDWGEVMPAMVDFLEGEGVKLLHNPDGSYLRTAGRGEPAWYINIADGQMIKRLIARKIRSMGADVLDHVMITKLLKKDGRVVGAAGYNVLDGTFYAIRAAGVILALGNSCNRATANSTGNPYNTWHSPFNTGSQFVLAYEAGADIINMDIKQQATLVPKGFGCAGMNGINSAGAHELNALGERFMGRYHPMMENCPRQFQVGGTYQQQVEGNGPPFYMEMRHIDAESLRHLQYTLMPGDKATFLDYCEQRRGFRHRAHGSGAFRNRIQRYARYGRRIQEHGARSVQRMRLLHVLRLHVQRLPCGPFRRKRSRRGAGSRRAGSRDRSRARPDCRTSGPARGRPAASDV